MPANPYEDEVKRQAQIGELRGEQPTSGTMPVGGARGVDPLAGAAPPVAASAPWGKGETKGSARQGADFARLGGGFGDAKSDSMKHTFGRVAQNFEHSDAGLQSLMADEEFRQLFPNAKLNKDWIDFGGQIDPHTGTPIGKIDVMRAWEQGGGGTAWQWLPEEEAIAGAQGAQGGGGAPMRPMGGGVNPAADSSALDRIMAELTAASDGSQSPAEREAVLAMLQGI